MLPVVHSSFALEMVKISKAELYDNQLISKELWNVYDSAYDKADRGDPKKFPSPHSYAEQVTFKHPVAQKVIQQKAPWATSLRAGSAEGAFKLQKSAEVAKQEKPPFFKRPVPRALLEAGIAAAGVGAGYVAGGAAHKALIRSGALKKFRALPPAQQAKAFRVGGTVLGLGATAGVAGIRYARAKKRRDERLKSKTESGQ